MLYEIAHILRDKLGFVWDGLESLNSLLFGLRYRKVLRELPALLESRTTELGKQRREGLPMLTFRLASKEDAAAMACFFARQPEESYTYFRPHGFDEKTIQKLIQRTSFLTMLVLDGEKVVGYFFLRSFVHGCGYLGKIVDADSQGQGIGKQMCLVAMDVALSLGIRMFESINYKNEASMRSSSVLKQVIVEELDDGDLLIEDLPLKNG